MKVNRTKGNRFMIPMAVLILGVLATAMLLWIERMSERQRIDLLQMDAVMDMQINAAIFHLWVDAFFSEGPKEDWQNILKRFDEALKLAHALFSGGESEHGEYLPPIDEPQIREHLEAVLALLRRFREVAIQRYDHPGVAWPGSPLDEQFDAAINDFMMKARVLETLGEKKLIDEIAGFRRMLFALVLIWTATVIALSIGLYTRELRRRRAERALEKAHEEMEQEVFNRTNELHETNRRLVAEIEERRQTERKLEKSRQEIQCLLEHFQSVREEERKWVAREIHDQLGQGLTNLNMDLTWLEKKLLQNGMLPGPEIIETINSMSNHIENAIRLIQEISSELRPGVLDDIGLTAAIEWQATRFNEKTGIKCHFNLSADEIQLDSARSSALFRIFQEVLTNVARHAGATEVRIDLTTDSRTLVLEVNDNGRGITDSDISDSRAFGIMGMKERVAALGGEFRIRGVPGQGTRVVISLPSFPAAEPCEKRDA